MLYSEVKERENRFIIALKIVFPFLLLIGVFLYSFKLFSQDVANFVLLVLLIPIYVYYIFYLIYNGFKKTLIDFTTKTFIRKEIISKINKIKNKKETTVILLHVSNIGDINERYGVANSDALLRNLIYKFDEFLRNNHFKNAPIGRYGGGNFLLLIKHPKKELAHILTIFSKELRNVGINNIEVKIEFALIEADYDKSVKNIIEKLFMFLEERKKNDFISPNIKPDIFEQIVYNAISKNELSFKYQPSINRINNEIEILEILTKIESHEHGSLSKAQIERVVNYAGYEKEFDEKVFSILLDDIAPLLDKKVLLSVEISPVSLRNNSFKTYLLALFRKKNIDPSRFILEVCEKNCYEDMHRFCEIITEYKKSGFKIALNNFGGNNCGFEYIKYLPVDIVKFDIEFTKKIEDVKYAKLLEMYMAMAHGLNIQTMMKFVDKELLFEKVKAFKPDFIQGFLVGKPKDLNHTVGELK